MIPLQTGRLRIGNSNTLNISMFKYLDRYMCDHLNDDYDIKSISLYRR